MKTKRIITVSLLLFVAASVAYLAARRIGGDAAADVNGPQTASRPAEPRQESPSTAAAEDRAAVFPTVVYYFHGNARCMTCRTIEAYAREAIEAAFDEAIQSGRLQWRTVNVERDGNEHYVRDFQLVTRSVVLEQTVEGRPRRWKNLDRVWQLVRGDKPTFLKYIQDETRSFLESAG